MPIFSSSRELLLAARPTTSTKRLRLYYPLLLLQIASTATAASFSMPPQTKPLPTTTTTTTTTNAIIVPSTLPSLQSCATRLRTGSLVAFPTETVYGLGCNALNKTAISKIYHAKQRPTTDPLIVHVSDATHAMQLWNPSTPSETRVLQHLLTKFFPGPLTLVAKAAPVVPSGITANTGYVAIRSPSHPIARKLISLAGVPIAAPSANTFGHVSPTRPEHVLADLHSENVWIVDSSSSTEEEPCRVGVESTVAKVENGIVRVLRHGKISPEDLRCCLREAGCFEDWSVEVQVKTVGDHENTVAPGQTMRHYAPNVPSCMISSKRFDAKTGIVPLSLEEEGILQSSVILDFRQCLVSWKTSCLAYRDLSPQGDSREAALCLFECLRWAEQVEGATRVFFPEVCLEEEMEKDGLKMALKDRLTRAASGMVVEDLTDILEGIEGG